MKTLASLAALGVLTLGACSTTSQATEGQALSAAQDGVAAALQAVHQAYQSGVISKAQVQKADAIADQADDISKAARAAYAAGDAGTLQGDVAQLTTLTAALVALEAPSK